MRTTDGRNAFATAENADDNTRASFGASVFGVIGPLGVRAGAEADPAAERPSSDFGVAARRWHAVATTALRRMTIAIRTDAI
jgi:hypothetical protein